MRLNEYVKVGMKIKKIRKSKGITQKKMAEDILNIPKSTYSNYENNNRVPDNETLEKIAAALNVTVWDFLPKEEKQEVGIRGLKENIKMRREDLGLSQDELAKKLGYKSRSTIAKIESGENDIPQSKIKIFANALETTPSELMGLGEEQLQKAYGKAYETTKKMNEKIKPCPFCGGEAINKSIDMMDNFISINAVVCKNCGATGMRSHIDILAVRAWNSRSVDLR